MSLSAFEVRYVESGVSEDVRADGRGRLECRPFRVSAHVLSQTNGSARVRMGANTDVVVGVKVELGEPQEDFPARGRVEVAVEWWVSLVCWVFPSVWSVPSPRTAGHGALMRSAFPFLPPFSSSCCCAQLAKRLAGV